MCPGAWCPDGSDHKSAAPGTWILGIPSLAHLQPLNLPVLPPGPAWEFCPPPSCPLGAANVRPAPSHLRTSLFSCLCPSHASVSPPRVSMGCEGASTSLPESVGGSPGTRCLALAGSPALGVLNRQPDKAPFLTLTASLAATPPPGRPQSWCLDQGSQSPGSRVPGTPSKTWACTLRFISHHQFLLGLRLT